MSNVTRFPGGPTTPDQARRIAQQKAKADLERQLVPEMVTAWFAMDFQGRVGDFVQMEYGLYKIASIAQDGENILKVIFRLTTEKLPDNLK